MPADPDRPPAAAGAAGAGPSLGLRERKKLKTRAAIQEHALRLFREQGYDATTIEQIAAAAEVSPSTFFRYFPTKEDVVLFDSTDPMMFDAFERQPPELSVIEALRRAFRETWDSLSPEELAAQAQRQELAGEVPEVRARMLSDLVGYIDVVAELVARRTGRSPDELAVRTFSGALIGLILGVFMAAPGQLGDLSHGDVTEAFDGAMAQLEAGLPL
jgi:AcrR family transcriptional regulator